MSDGNAQKDEKQPVEPHLADTNTLTDAAIWLATTAMGGILGNAAYAFARARLRSLIRRYGRRELLEKTQEIAQQEPAKYNLPPGEFAQRAEELVRQAENEPPQGGTP